MHETTPRRSSRDLSKRQPEFDWRVIKTSDKSKSKDYQLDRDQIAEQFDAVQKTLKNEYQKIVSFFQAHEKGEWFDFEIEGHQYLKSKIAALETWAFMDQWVKDCLDEIPDEKGEILSWMELARVHNKSGKITYRLRTGEGCSKRVRTNDRENIQDHSSLKPADLGGRFNASGSL